MQFRVSGLLDDVAIVESGRGAVYIGGKLDEIDPGTAVAMLSPDQAREYADRILEAAELSEII